MLLTRVITAKPRFQDAGQDQVEQADITIDNAMGRRFNS
jgi:hypothetical protein